MDFCLQLGLYAFFWRGLGYGRAPRSHVPSSAGNATLPSRNAARAEWARDIPSPIAADLLGINISTATQWASRTRRDWTDYIAERAQTQERHAREGQE